METITTKTEVFSFAELAYSAKQTARQWYCDTPDAFWAESVIEDAKEIGALMGFNIENIYYSGFYSPGGGACFTGAIRYAKSCAKNVKARAPMDAELQRIAQAWQDLQKRNFFALRASIKHSGRYSHAMCTAFECEDTRHNYGQLQNVAIEDEIKEIARDFMRWIYRQLESAYEYETSEENIAEMCELNEWRFTEDGKFFRS